MAILLEGLPEGQESQSVARDIGKVSWDTLPFAGYHSEVEEAKKILEAGLDTSSLVRPEVEKGIFKMKFKRPRGLLLTGPRGIGKTLLMNSLKEFFSPLVNSVHTLSPDILLSRFVPNTH